jgi:hypothetical protein
MTQRPSAYVFQGGLDEITSPLIVPKGRVIGCKNHESVSGGYARVGGFERFDGRISPTTAFLASPEDGAVAAREAARAAIHQVPGAGPVRGVACYKGERYAWRDNAAGTAGVMHRATPAGWVPVPLMAGQSWPAGGRYLTENHNFYGASARKRMYGCNGVGPGFEFDGTAVTFISTGMPVDAPNRIAIYKQQLFFSFPGGSVQHSQVGEPLMWEAKLGAGEIGVGSDVTDMIETTDALHIFTIDAVNTLVGNDEADFVLQPLATEEGQGAIPFSTQKVGVPMYLDVGGLRSITSTNAYGNFRLGALTPQVQPTLGGKRRSGIAPVASCVVKGKDQYRLFFNDGTGVSVYFGRKYPEPMLFDLPFAVSCLAVEPAASAGERVFAGASDGFVYELDAGTSYDGDEIIAYLQLPWDNEGSSDVLKRWHKATIELAAEPNTQIGMFAEFDYGDGEQRTLPQQEFTVTGGGGLWNTVSWDEFFWSAPAEGKAECYLDGQGENMSLVIVSQGTEQFSYVLSSLRKKITVRGAKR